MNKKLSNSNIVDIAIATFNGEKYIRLQLDSILSSENFSSLVNKIVVSDDGSSDSTFSILQEYAQKYSFIELHKNTQNHGIVGNFENAISHCHQKYIMLSDQDDYWYPSKLSILTNGIVELENKSVKNVPCLFFTDLKVVDNELNILNESFFGIIKYDLNLFFQRNTILLTNIVPGCAMVFNKELKNIALPIRKGIYLHDWWLLLLARYGGCVGFSSESTFMYRQHQNNAVGVVRKSRINKIQDLFREIEKPDEIYGVSQDVRNRLSEHNLVTNNSVLYQIEEIKNKSRLKKILFAVENLIFFRTTSLINTIARNFRLVFLYLFRKS